MGLGKNRTKLGGYLDDRKITQKELEEVTGLSRSEVARLCDGNKNVLPLPETMQRIVSSLRKKGHDVRVTDFWSF